MNQRKERYSNDFQSNLVGFDFETLELSKYSIYGISKELTFTYFNPAFVLFSKKNGFKGNILEHFPIGTSIIDSIKGKKIKDFYKKRYEDAILNKKVWHHEYECSSQKKFRQFHQQSYPLRNGEGLIIINTLKVTTLMEQTGRISHDAILKNYTQETGFITQCCNCRHVQSVINKNEWHWVPAWVEKFPKNVSHSICPTCFDYHWKYSKASKKKE